MKSKIAEKKTFISGKSDKLFIVSPWYTERKTPE
jgi:hypothetical protein